MISLQDMDEKELERQIEERAYEQMEESMDLEYRDDGYLQLVLKILGLMCDGQNATLQDYLREQVIVSLSRTWFCPPLYLSFSLSLSLSLFLFCFISLSS